MLITFEGIDGSGKSTQIQLLKHFIESDLKQAVIVYREPGGNVVSEKIRSLLLDTDFEIQPVTEMLLFSAARAQLVADDVLPKLKKGFIVILDRFFDSTTAYQGYGRGAAPIEEIHALNHFAALGLKPDITFYLRLDLEQAQMRRSGDEKDRMERSGNAFYERVIQGFDDMASKENRFKTIDANQSKEAIHQLVKDSVLRLIQK
jgi:dTMP kinase